MNLTREQIQHKFTFLEIKPITQQNYITKIYYLYNLLKPLQKNKDIIKVSTFKQFEGVKNVIENKWDNVSSKSSYTNAILSLLKIVNLHEYKTKFYTDEKGVKKHKLKPIYAKYYNYFKELRKLEQVKIQTDEFKTFKYDITDETINEMIRFNTAKFENTLKLDYLQNVIILHIYFKQAPPRADIADMIIKKTGDNLDHKFNYAILDELKFHYFNYKTDKRGIKVVDFSKEIYNLLKIVFDNRKPDKDGNIYLLLGTRNNKPLTAQTLSKKFKRLTGVSINHARKRWSSKDGMGEVVKKINKNANDMMNSFNVQLSHYIKN